MTKNEKIERDSLEFAALAHAFDEAAQDVIAEIGAVDAQSVVRALGFTLTRTIKQFQLKDRDVITDHFVESLRAANELSDSPTAH